MTNSLGGRTASKPRTSASHRTAKGRCPHRPQCPAATARNRAAARVVALHPEQGWSLLCNGVVVFDDTGELLPDRRVVDHGAALMATALNAAAAQ
ncbi:hypothetical protein GCM10023196_013950 [Actinoallomurus vinaceus]|uniref:Uncharacterized protein n=1 Tax=Actinoallomurus vinaceus TaxID=1080074 RepID=A0ABP8U4R6_9ACTN